MNRFNNEGINFVLLNEQNELIDFLFIEIRQCNENRIESDPFLLIVSSKTLLSDSSYFGSKRYSSRLFVIASSFHAYSMFRSSNWFHLFWLTSRKFRIDSIKALRLIPLFSSSISFVDCNRIILIIRIKDLIFKIDY